MADIRDIIADVSDETKDENVCDGAIVAWVLDKVDMWEDHRIQNYDDKFLEYQRINRGIWNEMDKTRKSERSRLISPATQQAVEATVSELEEATFGKGLWFDVADDVQDQDRADMMLYRDVLREDLENADVPSEIAKVYLNGAIFGTGIAKVYVTKKLERDIRQGQDELGNRQPRTEERERVVVGIEAINPMEFVIDPTARNVDDALGCAHVMVKPRHIIMERIRKGVYRDVEIGAYPDKGDLDTEMDMAHPESMDDQTRLVEYYGKLPASLVEKYENRSDEDTSELGRAIAKQSLDTPITDDDDDLIEVFVTIANDTALLRVVRNPHLMQDRPIVAYQHDTVTTSFWGRGVVEKGYNAQKALDAELRARTDAMGLVTAPMIAIDAARIPRGHKPESRPGKIWYTNGPPSETVMPFNLGNVNPSTFHQAGDLERMVQMATGAMDSAAPVSQNARNQTASGMSMMNSQFIKRNKRAMQNIERQFLSPMIRKAAWRYIQFYPEKYPAVDFKFKVLGTMGIMAREFEQGQLTQLLSIVPPDSPTFNTLIQGIFENSSLSNKSQLLQSLQTQEQMMQQQQQLQQLQAQTEQLKQQIMMLDMEKTKSEVVKNLADAKAKTDNADVNRTRVQIDAAMGLMDKAKGVDEEDGLEQRRQ